MSESANTPISNDTTLAKVKSLAKYSGTVASFVAWLALLASTLPAVSREWTFDWADRALSPSAYLTTTFGYVYLGLCALVILAFVLFGSQRRKVFLAFLAFLVFVQIRTDAIGWDRVALYLTAIALLTVLVEAVRQNIPLYRDLRRNHIAPLKLLGQSLVLWSPLLLIILTGVYANKMLLDATERMVYDTTPIDEWCEVDDGRGVQVIPCVGMEGIVTPDDVTEVPRDLAVERQVQSKISQATSELLAAIESPEPPEWLGEGLENAQINKVIARMNAIRILDIESGPDPAIDVIRTDEKIATLDRQIKKKQAQIARTRREIQEIQKKLPKGFIGFGLTNNALQQAINAKLKPPTDELRALKKQRSAREALLRRKAVAQEMSAPDGPVNALRRKINQVLGGVKSRPNGHQLRHIKQKDLTERRNRLMMYVVRSMDTIEAQTLKNVRRAVANQKDDATVYAAMLMTERCTTERENPEVKDILGNTTMLNRGEFRCFSAHPADGLALTPVGLRRSTDLSIDRWQTDKEIDGMNRLRELSRKNFKTADEAAKAAKDLGKAVPENVDLGRKECHYITNPINCITNFVKKKTENAYADARIKLDRNYNRAVDRKTGAVARSADTEIVAARADMYRTLESSAELMRVLVDRLQQAGKLLAVFLSLILILAVIKSFLYVLATRIFDAKSSLHIDLGADLPVQGEYVSGPSVSIPRDFNRELITREVLDNQENSTALIPWPFSAPVARILRSAYFVFNKGGHFEHGQEEMSFTRGSGHHIVDWRMKEGEEVVFHYRNFFGASDNIKLKTTISLRLATILLGRFVFHSAVCTGSDGRLLLTAAGTVNDEAKTDSTSLDRLIAWNRHTRFRVSSKGTVKSVFLDGYTMVRTRQEGEPCGLIVVEAIGDGGRRISGAVRFIRTLLMPF